MNTQPDKPREAILVLLHHDKWVEVYGEHNIDVRIAVMPRMSTPKGQQLAEEYLGLILPKRYRDIYFPGNLRASDLVRIVTMQDIAKQKWDMKMLKTMDGIETRSKGAVTTWVA